LRDRIPEYIGLGLSGSKDNLYAFIRLVVGDRVSDREISRRAGLSWRSFLALKQGKRVSARVSELQGMAEALGVDSALLFEAARGTPAGRLHDGLCGRDDLHGLVLPRAADAARERAAPETPGEAPASAGVLRLSVDNVCHGVLGLDLEGRIVAATRAVLDLTGYSLTQLRKLSLWDIVVTSHRRRLAQHLAETYTSGVLHDFGVSLVRRDGTRMPTIMDGMRVDGAGGAPLGLQLLVREHLRQPELRATELGGVRMPSGASAAATIDDERCKVRVSNVSTSGVRLVSRVAASKGQTCKLDWLDHGDQVEASGRIVWAARTGERCWHLGVHLEDMSSSVRAHLAELVKSGAAGRPRRRKR
jgi:PAS domain S-box-containing protein